MSVLFLDTGYMIALEIASDQNHQTALNHWKNLVSGQPTLVTTSYVFDEIVTFFNSRGFHSKAVEIGNNLLSSPSINLIQVEEPLFQKAWLYFQKHHDKGYSLTDCLSFLVMEDLNIETALSFDKHFSQAGFQKLP
ncbi:nucleic acid-binding protein [bacterium (Candidatus Blackallbacteria) CG17_big_fil_post_rev_8_21_14_2_50_48_46]|uniref:Nucleic acid-binding protein n=1 Tax=bacterium (Candidatus Blackallbacteria) CG17_big_fil_post_rev_8_21_14_2_50_48_46 TaxID=2014261 RepID=A0A2M7G6J5_9BACT|nr:MAG: nucleic acid-binding protein [bacterium (Candidatus Blackallbacteria) CG18_big_fil_WC_8_21_14_2_50_49_26]PIW17645.1 MAG: nucleic acid-binding protein [bacterium (Candidatus Blackallbacteria) CG17_big_fil_post_rev_8_21_14_2_50_48_46]PIW49304.1 MAG: nucleic acid-binding protein [bacterium (Candidatus Blackallbacteria) CG13_big_fil_rev_8_21_14_2_50_49_14]